MSVDNNKLHRVLVASFHECWNCAAYLKSILWLREPRRKLESSFRGCENLAVHLKAVFVVAGIIFSYFLEHPATKNDILTFFLREPAQKKKSGFLLSFH